ncbi:MULTISPECIES: tryptophan synthase subunit alpha [Fictibacillus]|uniref:tryptophan synthase subunit alpha n=1 Tax=Fictibacillus TaxID=1329200 RepID=UPI0004229F36|nr:tryptophan synthase subunit alpha [Fictibacillus gelatini]
MGASRFERFEKGEKPLFVPFITAGDPTSEITVELALSLEKVGADAIELGIPYSDPLADGPVIQRASSRALQAGMTLEKAMKLVSSMREKGLKIPVIIFTYYNLLLQLGEERFFALASENDIDGLLVPDLPFEESGELRQQCQNKGISFISLVAPTTSKERLKQIGHSAKGFLYCISSLGVTGVRRELSSDLDVFLKKAKEYSNVPVLIGFGLSNKEQMQSFNDLCDGFIIGSRIVSKIEELGRELIQLEKRKEALESFEEFVSSLVPSFVYR